MRDLTLQCAGAAAILVAIIHGVLGETKVFAKATIQPERLRTLIRLVWQAGTVAWIGGGVLLIAAPWMASEPARHWIVVTLACVFDFAAWCGFYAGNTVNFFLCNYSVGFFCCEIVFFSLSKKIVQDSNNYYT